MNRLVQFVPLNWTLEVDPMCVTVARPNSRWTCDAEGYTSLTKVREITQSLPLKVQELFPREREVATVVYARGSATAVDVQRRLSAPLSNGAIRSMLNRLVAKGILHRERRGRHGCFVYRPALYAAVVTENALRQLADDYFKGSLHRAALAMLDLLEAERDRAA